MRQQCRLWMCCLAMGFVAGLLTSSRVANAGSDEERRLQQVAEKYAAAPVDARVDRVWHAIPGLSGWTIDLPASVRQTDRVRDGRLHLVWQPVPPKTRLAQLPPEPVYRGPAVERTVSLMFNVSWGEEYIEPILRTLADKRVKATFFLDGAWVRKHPQLAKEIATAGHDIGSHGTGHPDMRKLPAGQLMQQMTGSKRIIQEVTGVTVSLLAPPAGAFDMRTVRAARTAGMYTILWTTDTIDWRRPAASVICDRVWRGAQPGALVLMHPTAQTAQALSALIDGLRARGYGFKTVQQVVSEQRVAQPPQVASP